MMTRNSVRLQSYFLQKIITFYWMSQNTSRSLTILSWWFTHFWKCIYLQFSFPWDIFSSIIDIYVFFFIILIHFVKNTLWSILKASRGQSQFYMIQTETFKLVTVAAPFACAISKVTDIILMQKFFIEYKSAAAITLMRSWYRRMGCLFWESCLTVFFQNGWTQSILFVCFVYLYFQAVIFTLQT